MFCSRERSKARAKDPKNKPGIRSSFMKCMYGITEDDFQRMFAEQGHKCACCGTRTIAGKRGWMVDHCHATGLLRGIICYRCNSGLGILGDSVDRLLMAVAYLQKERPAIYVRKTRITNNALRP